MGMWTWVIIAAIGLIALKLIIGKSLDGASAPGSASTPYSPETKHDGSAIKRAADGALDSVSDTAIATGAAVVSGMAQSSSLHGTGTTSVSCDAQKALGHKRGVVSLT